MAGLSVAILAQVASMSKKPAFRPITSQDGASSSQIVSCLHKGIVIKTEAGAIKTENASRAASPRPASPAPSSAPSSGSAMSTPVFRNSERVGWGLSLKSGSAQIITFDSSDDEPIQNTMPVAAVGVSEAPVGNDGGVAHDADLAAGSASTTDMVQFQNKIRSKKLPNEVRNLWSDMKQLPKNDSKRLEFQRQLANATVKDISTDPYFVNLITVRKTIGEESKDGEQGGWKSYHRCCKDDGADVIDEMIRMNTIETRVDPRLPPGHQVKWPRCLQLEWDDQVWSRFATAKEAITLRQSGAVGDEAVEAFTGALDAAKRQPMRSQHRVAPYPATGQSTAAARPETKPDGPDLSKLQAEQEERDRTAAVKEAVKQLGIAHGVWHRKKLEFNGTAKKAEVHNNTKNSDALVAFNTFIEEGDNADAEIQALLEAHGLSRDLTKEQVDQASSVCDNIVTTVKRVSKKNVSLKEFMKA